MTSVIQFSYRENGTKLTIIYDDNGVGIDPEIKKRLFMRGNGLNHGYGLFLIREILAITGISIVETGEPGKGARFEITIPTGAYRFTTTRKVTNGNTSQESKTTGIG
jgi:sensor histidine kinase regulating citrate/malate metabolism